MSAITTKCAANAQSIRPRAAVHAGGDACGHERPCMVWQCGNYVAMGDVAVWPCVDSMVWRCGKYVAIGDVAMRRHEVMRHEGSVLCVHLRLNQLVIRCTFRPSMTGVMYTSHAGHDLNLE